MPINDLWYLKTLDPRTGTPKRSSQHGKGRRWEVRWTDPKTKRRRGKRFTVRAEAAYFDARQRAERAELARDTLTIADVLRHEV